MHTVCLYLCIYFSQNLKIIIIGPPVSGKTTLARKLAEHYGLVHLEYKLIVQNHINAIVSLLFNNIQYTILIKHRYFFLYGER